MEIELSGEVFFWRGPAPFHFVAIHDEQSAEILEIAHEVTYGWGMVPVLARIGGTTWSTSLFPKDGGYLLPVRAAVRRAEKVELGDVVTVRLTVAVD